MPPKLIGPYSVLETLGAGGAGTVYRALDRRTNARLSWYDGFFESLGLSPDFAERYARAVEAVTAEDVQRVAQTYLATPTVVRLGPAAP